MYIQYKVLLFSLNPSYAYVNLFIGIWASYDNSCRVLKLELTDHLDNFQIIDLTVHARARCLLRKYNRAVIIWTEFVENNKQIRMRRSGGSAESHAWRADNALR